MWPLGHVGHVTYSCTMSFGVYQLDFLCTIKSLVLSVEV
jgi:hypothetical protein